MSRKSNHLKSLREARLGPFFRPKEVEVLGVSRTAIERLVKKGDVEKVGPGLYRLTEIEPDEQETVAMVASAIPDGVICLLTALRHHDIGTQNPHEIWIAIDRRARKPTHLPAKVRLFRFSGAMMTYGIQTKYLRGLRLRITSPARTVIDCFRYRKKLGMDVALEALREAVRGRKVTTEELVRAAETCRVQTVMRPYLEALSL